MILDDEEEAEATEIVEDNEDEGLPGTELDVCLNALSGKLKRNTITLFGSIRNTPTRILIDTGSTHSYIHCQIAQTLELQQRRS